MNPIDLPDGLDVARLARVLDTVHDQVSTALWLSAGMLCAFAAIACIALGWRRTALVWGLFYSLSLCFVRNGHAQILGPAGCAVALVGFLWPRPKRPD